MTNYKVFCLHHSPLEDRKKYLENKKKEFNFNFEYVETHQPNTSEFNNPYRINDAELSVTLKILDIFKQMKKEKIDYCFIFEDDIIIEFDLIPFFEQIIEQSENVDLVFWGGTSKWIVNNPLSEKIVYDGYKKSRCGHGMMFTKETCIRILNNYDYTFNKQFDLQINNLINRLKLNCAWTSPYVKQKTFEKIEKSSIRP